MTVLLAFMLAASAPDGRAEVEARHRVVGLFSPERVDVLKEAFTKISDAKLVSVDYEHAEVTLAYEPQKLSGKKLEKEILERLNNLVRQATGHTIGIAPLVTTPREKLVKVEIGVVGLDCKACALAAYEVIAKVEGVAAATCSFKDGRLTALLDPEKTDKAALEDALKKRQVTLK